MIYYARHLNKSEMTWGNTTLAWENLFYERS